MASTVDLHSRRQPAGRIVSGGPVDEPPPEIQFLPLMAESGVAPWLLAAVPTSQRCTAQSTPVSTIRSGVRSARWCVVRSSGHLRRRLQHDLRHVRLGTCPGDRPEHRPRRRRPPRRCPRPPRATPATSGDRPPRRLVQAGWVSSGRRVPSPRGFRHAISSILAARPSDASGARRRSTRGHHGRG